MASILSIFIRIYAREWRCTEMLSTILFAQTHVLRWGIKAEDESVIRFRYYVSIKV